jgi:hypothetical protein
MILSTQFRADEQFQPNDSDWAEFVAYCEEQDAAQADLDRLPTVEPSAAEWSSHVREYLASHNLAEVPF